VVSYSEREELRHVGLSLGFARIGFTDATTLSHDRHELQEWLTRGYAAEMHYMVRDGLARTEPQAFLPGARSVIVFAVGLGRADPQRQNAPIAHYGCRPDYHVVVHAALERFVEVLRSMVGPTLLVRQSVDSVPLSERGLAAKAGVAFIGKSTMAIVPGLGSHVMLAALVTNVAIDPDEPLKPRCGSCRQCLQACPTAAFPRPYQVDSRHCLAYLTIEHAKEIPLSLRPSLGQRVFGCDLCQAACPFNRGRTPAPLFPGLEPRSDLLCQTPPLAWLTLTARQHKRLVRQTPLARFYRHQWARNTALALANAGNSDAIPILADLLGSHPEVLVRQHVAWALGQLAPGHALLRQSAQHDPADVVRSEAQQAIAATR